MTKTPTIVLVDEDDFCGSVGGVLMLPLAVALSLLSVVVAVVAVVVVEVVDVVISEVCVPLETSLTYNSIVMCDS